MRVAVRMIGVALLASACAAMPSDLRFQNREPHWIVDDRQPIAKPRETRFERFDADMWFYSPIRYTLEVPDHRGAANINALGEVPDSSWFTNRIGVHDMNPDEIRRGPNDDDGPIPPFFVSKLRDDGQGVLAKDARGKKYLLEVDPPSVPEMASGAGIVAQRFLWAVGYNVPEDSIAQVHRDDFTLLADAERETAYGDVPLDEIDIDTWLAGQPKRADGRVRVLASKFVPGKPIGPYADDGTRKDDANDRVRHEHRRDLRGQFVFFAWLAHTDINPSNRLDMWVEDPRDPDKGHVVHWLLDFDRALGVIAKTNDVPWDGYSYTIDYGFIVASTLGLGFWRRPWEKVRDPRLPGIGRFESEHFRLGGFRPRHWYAPFLHMDDADIFWAAKILMRLRVPHIVAAVEAGGYSDPRSQAYLISTLIARQRSIGRDAFTRIAPLDQFHVVDTDVASLCATDLLLHYELASAHATTTYRARAFDFDGNRTGWVREAAPDRSGQFCLVGLHPPADNEGYLIIEIRTRRGRRAHAPVFVHLARAPGSHRLRVIGIDRRRDP